MQDVNSTYECAEITEIDWSSEQKCATLSTRVKQNSLVLETRRAKVRNGNKTCETASRQVSTEIDLLRWILERKLRDTLYLNETKSLVIERCKMNEN